MRRLSERDLAFLCLCAEQHALRADHARGFLSLSERQGRRRLSALVEDGLLARFRPLAGPPWFTPTTAGLLACACPYRPWRPRISALPHIGAVASVRLHIQERAPQAFWTCERALALERTDGSHLPDGVVCLDDMRIAIEVELTVKSAGRLCAILASLSERYDQVVYFATPAVRGRMERLRLPERFPALSLRDLPEASSLVERAAA